MGRLIALILGDRAGVAAIGGLPSLIVRRRSTRTARRATTANTNTKMMYVLQFGGPALGLSSTLWNIGTPVHDLYDCRKGISP